MRRTFRLIGILIICATVLAFGYIAFADVTFKLQVPLPDYPQSSIDLCTGSATVECYGIAQYIKIVYEWLIRLAVVLGAAALVIAGLLWLTAAGDSKRVDTSKSVIKNTLIGLILAFGSYALLWTINPNLVDLKGLQLGKKIEEMEIKMEWVSTEESDSVITPQEAAQQDAAALAAAATGTPGAAPGAVGGGTNGVPLFKQRNYRAFSYGSCGTISSAGCGPTSTAMVMKFYGKNVTPVDVARLFEGANVRQCNGSCSPTKCTCCANQWHAFTDRRTVGAQGLKGEIISGKNAVLSLLQQNKPIVASMGPSIFTTGGHFIVLTGIAPNGNILINDPAGNHPQATQEQVFPYMKGAWYIHP